MKLNKWEELSAYYFMLAAFENQEDYCFCSCSLYLFNIYPNESISLVVHENDEHFPSVYPLLFSKRPKVYGSCWFEISKGLDTNRINLLKECISELEEELYK